VTLGYLLDTNILAEPLRPNPNAQVLEHLRRHQEEVAIPAVVWHEMWFGCHRLPPSAKRQAIETYLTQVVAPSIPVLPYDQDAARWHAAERARLAALGKTPPIADGMIAAIASTHGLVLVTLNLDDFRAFQGLALDNWLGEQPLGRTSSSGVEEPKSGTQLR
jgi:tRNA(fMet)-specific endonuclease VapC